MTNLGIIFLTGLTTGGLSCLAIQGGLLASSVAQQAEDDLLNAPVDSAAAARRSVWPVLLFLGSRLLSYTILGALLGVAGSMLQLTPYTRATLQIGIGIYMLGLALHLLSVHPFFRYFMLQPPRFVTRYIRRKAKAGNGDLVTPTFLGLVTVFIPCGITIAMMALAIGTGNGLGGAAIMFAFILGTSPLFFALALAAVKLGARKQAVFLKFAALIVFVLGLVALEGGLNLAGSSLSVANISQSLRERNQPAAASAPTDSVVLRMSATSLSYSPSVIKAKASQPYKLEITSRDNQGCGRGLIIPSLGIQKVLPENGVETIDLPAQKKGTMRLTCSMGMYNSKIQFE